MNETKSPSSSLSLRRRRPASDKRAINLWLGAGVAEKSTTAARSRYNKNLSQLVHSLLELENKTPRGLLHAEIIPCLPDGRPARVRSE